MNIYIYSYVCVCVCVCVSLTALISALVHLAASTSRPLCVYTLYAYIHISEYIHIHRCAYVLHIIDCIHLCLYIKQQAPRFQCVCACACVHISMYTHLSTPTPTPTAPRRVNCIYTQFKKYPLIHTLLPIPTPPPPPSPTPIPILNTQT